MTLTHPSGRPITKTVKPRAIALAATLAAAILPCSFSAPAHHSVWVSSLDLSKIDQWLSHPNIGRSSDGHPLTLDGRVYDHGLGLHARSQMAIGLDGKGRRFTATVGVDDEVGKGHGSVEFRVLGDGRRILWNSGVMRAGDAPRQVAVALEGEHLLTLLVSEAGDGSDKDHADWADARIEFDGQPPQTVPANIGSHAEKLGPQVAIASNPTPLRPEINAPRVAGIRPGTPFLFAISADGAMPLHYSADGLPPGLSLDPVTGQIRGEVAKPGDYPVALRVTNRHGEARGTLLIRVGSTLALTPPMGWNSYDNFGGGVNEAQVLETARTVADRLERVGWQYVVIDYLWFEPVAGARPPQRKPLVMDSYGRLLPAPNRFPSAVDNAGFKPIADRIHAMGLRFGIHIMRGIPRPAVEANLPIEGSSYTAAEAADRKDTCSWNEDMYGVRGDTPAGQAYYDSIFRLYASWGVDFVKVDDISSPYHQGEIEAIRRAIDRCGRSIVLSLSPGAAPIDKAANLIANANQWRVTGDFWDNWDQLEEQFGRGAAWGRYAGPGHWPDADMLPLGHIGEYSVGPGRETNFTKPEQMTLLTLWSILPSPLMVGADLPRNNAWTTALLTNPEVLGVNQDSLGTGARRVLDSGNAQVWCKPLADGSLAVAFFNRGETDQPVTVTWSQLGLSGAHAVRDLWLRKDLGVFDTGFTANVASHGASFVRVLRSDK